MKREVIRDSQSRDFAIHDLAVSAGLPADLAATAGKRLGIISLIYAVSYAFLYLMSRALEEFPTQRGSLEWLNADVSAGIFVGISLLVFAVAISGRVNPYRLLELGLIYEFIGAVGIEIDLLWWPAFGLWPEDGSFAVNGISWTGPWIIIFPLLVPATPRRVSLAALASASVRPLMLLVLAAQGVPFASAGVGAAALVDLIAPNYICAAVAIIGARVVWGYGSHISAARRMGSYRLVEKLGEGGMGEVWRAEHLMLARPAAIKLIRTDAGPTKPGQTPGNIAQRFEREVQATAELRSPHSVAVYDFGFTADRTFYYVMELLDGFSLQRLVERYGPLPAERVIHILRQACHSLAEAHMCGMVHRDIKPGNIFICRYGLEVDFVKLLDFGLVKRVAGATRQDRELTAAGIFTGTPAYGSPEAALAAGEEIDARSDIYSLGCVAFWLLTGRTVFEAETPMMMLVKHVKETPAPPSTYSELEMPTALDELILECLRKDAKERPDSAEAVAARLDAIRVRKPWTRERARQWWDLHAPEPATAATTPSEQHLLRRQAT